MTEAAKLMLGAMLGALNSILGDFANSLLSQVLSFYVDFNFRTMFTADFLRAYAIVWGFGTILTLAAGLVGILTELLNGKGRFHRIGVGALKAIAFSPVIPFLSYVIFGVLNTIVRMIVASGNGFGASVSGLSGTGSALSLPGALLLVMQLACMWAVLALTVLLAPILMVAFVSGNWGSRFMRGIYVVIGTTMLTQPVSLLVLVIGFFVSRLEKSMGLPGLITAPTPVIFFVLAAIAPVAILVIGYVKIVKVEGGQLDESGKGEVESTLSYGNSPIRSIIEGSVPMLGSVSVPFAGELAGSAGSQAMELAKSPQARNVLSSLLQSGGAEAAMLAIGQPELIPVAKAVGPALGRMIAVPEPTESLLDGDTTELQAPPERAPRVLEAVAAPTHVMPEGDESA